MKNRIIFFALFINLICFGQEVVYPTKIGVVLPYGNITNKLPVEDSLLLTHSRIPEEAHHYKLKWSIAVGEDVMQVWDDSSGWVKAIKPGYAKVKCEVVNKADVFIYYDLYVVAAPVINTSFNMTFTSGNTEAWIGEESTDSLAVYTMQMEGGYLKLIIDKACLLDSATMQPVYSWVMPSRGFRALRLSLCPVSGVLMDMSKTPIITMKIRSTTNGRFQLGYASKNTAGNPSAVTRIINASENFTLMSFYYGDLSWGPGDKKAMLVDSSKVSHLFLNFNPGPLNTSTFFEVAGPGTKFTQPNDFKGTVEIQYIRYGDVADTVKMTSLDIKQIIYIRGQRTKNVFEPDSLVRLKTNPQYAAYSLPKGVSIPYVDWSVSDSSIAEVMPMELDSGLYNICRLVTKKAGTIKLIAKSRDGSNLVVEKTIRIYDPAIVTQLLDDYLALYPNPVKDNINIESAENISMVNIYSVTGQLVFADKHSGAEVYYKNIEQLNSGIYFLRTTLNDGTILSKKFIKE